RSGCYFCFFQQKVEWVGLLENHPDLFEQASRYERIDPDPARTYTWAQGESLGELAQSERVAQIKAENAKRLSFGSSNRSARTLVEVFSDLSDELEDDDRACLICEL
ncbi:MAG: phosphoadenosine phosphosulfate reductase, partial [Bacteroidota bacterium]